MAFNVCMWFIETVNQCQCISVMHNVMGYILKTNPQTGITVYFRQTVHVVGFYDQWR